MELNDKQKKFCREYMIDFNGKQAAIRAGYSEKTADVKASQLLRIVKVQTFLSELKKGTAERTDTSADDLTQFYKGVMYDTTENTRDRIKAAENLSKRIGYYQSHNQQKAKGVQNALEVYARMHEEREAAKIDLCKT